MFRNWIILLLFPVNLLAQKNPCPCPFQAVLSTGVLGGESTAKPLFQLSGGLNYKRFFAGLGGGADFYRFKSIPVYADLRYNFGKMSPGFLYGNAGYSFPFDNGSAVEWESSFITTNRYKGGFYMDAGLGYRIRLGGWNNLLLSAGYSYKRISELTGYTYPCLIEPCPEEIYRKQYNLGRVVTKLSWELSRNEKAKH